jgi:hypothetical protein
MLVVHIPRESQRMTMHTAHTQMARKNSKLQKTSSVIFGVKEFMNFPHYLHRLYPSVKDGAHCTLLITGTYNYKPEIHRLEVSNLLKANPIASCTIIDKPVRQAPRYCVSLSVCIWRSASHMKQCHNKSDTIVASREFRERNIYFNVEVP